MPFRTLYQMRKLALSLTSGLLTIASLLSCKGHGNGKFGTWTVSSRYETEDLQWQNFYWAGDSVGNRWVERMAMMVPARLNGLSYPFLFQFDIGSDLTMIYGNPLKPYLHGTPSLAGTYNKTGAPYLKDLQIVLDSMVLQSPAAYIKQDYGETIAPEEVKNNVPKHMGTIGVDVCKDKVLVIDYPHKKFCLTDAVPKEFQTYFADISLDGWGRPVLKMEYKGETYKVLFDCGSSIFPLLTSQRLASKLSAAPFNDTIAVSAFGKMVSMIGKPMRDSFRLAGHSFANVEIYAGSEPAEHELPEGCDATTGNILFWNSIIVIDFRNKKFGIID